MSARLIHLQPPSPPLSSETGERGAEAGLSMTAPDVTEEEEAQSRSSARLKYQGSALYLCVLRSRTVSFWLSARVV